MLTRFNGKNYQVIKIPTTAFNCIRTVLSHIFPDITLDSYELTYQEVEQVTREIERREILSRR
jgi:hypothetical protein